MVVMTTSGLWSQNHLLHIRGLFDNIMYQHILFDMYQHILHIWSVLAIPTYRVGNDNNFQLVNFQKIDVSWISGP